MSEWKIGRYTIWLRSNTLKCEVCEAGHIHIGWDGIGHLCLKHTLDWMLDTYESDVDYRSIDDWAPTTGDGR